MPSPTPLNPPSSLIEIVQIGNFEEIPIAEILKNLVFEGIATSITDPEKVAITMDANQTQAVLTVPVLQGTQGNPGNPGITTRFVDQYITDLNSLPTDLGDFVGDLGKFFVFAVNDPVTGNPIATTIFLWTGLVNGIYTGTPGLGQGWVQIPVGTPGPPGVYPNIQPKLVKQTVGSGLGPGGVDSWVAVDTTQNGTPAAPLATFNIAIPQGAAGTSCPFGGMVDVDLQTTPPNFNDFIVCSSRTTPAAPTGLGATGHTTGGTIPAGTYKYVVTAVVPNGETVASNEVSATLTGSTSSVGLAWTAPSGNGATGYRVYRGTQAGQENVLVAVITSGTQVSFTDTGAPTVAGSPPITGIPAGKPIWVNSGLRPSQTQFLTAPESIFVSQVSIQFGAGVANIATYAMPPQPFPWVPMVYASCVINGINLSLTPLLQAAQVTLASPTGQLLSTGVSDSGGVMQLRPDFGTAWTPQSNFGTVPANHTGTQGTLYMGVVNNGAVNVFSFNAGNHAQLSVLVVPLA